MIGKWYEMNHLVSYTPLKISLSIIKLWRSALGDLIFNIFNFAVFVSFSPGVFLKTRLILNLSIFWSNKITFFYKIWKSGFEIFIGHHLADYNHRIESVDENGRLCNKETKIKFKTVVLLKIQEKIIVTI